MSRLVLICLMLLGMVFNQDVFAACNAPRSKTKLADFGKTAMPIPAYAISLYKQDWVGVAVSAALINGLYALNNPLEKKFHKKRPCGCQGSFPSGHMVMYASSASYLHYRYGWQYGFPAYVASFIFAADRVRNKAHGWEDMIGTFLAVNLISYIVVPRFNDEVEYLPPSWLEDRKKEKEAQKNLVHRLTTYEKRLEPLPIATASKDSVVLGLTMKF